MTHAERQETLAELRREIDGLDSQMHQLLIRRGLIIDRLIAAKASETAQAGSSAFRPGREADMMRALVSRHSGLLPLDTVESIWRIIISTFTYVQSPYAVHADVSTGDARMRDGCRFHFGFTVPYEPKPDAAAVVAAVAASAGDLGIAPVAPNPAASGWRKLLRPENAPKIIARLPFVERPDHPAGLPLFVIANPLAAAAVREVAVYDLDLGGAPPPDPGALSGALAALGAEAAPFLAGEDALLISAPGEVSRHAIAAAAGRPPDALHEIGGHAARCEAEEARRDPAPFLAAQ